MKLQWNTRPRIEIHYKCFICLIEHSLNFKFIWQNIFIVTKSIAEGFFFAFAKVNVNQSQALLWSEINKEGQIITLTKEISAFNFIFLLKY